MRGDPARPLRIVSAGSTSGSILCGSDVVLGLDAHLAGFRNVCSPAVEVRHLESATRGTFSTYEDMFTSYWRYQRWITGGDPYFAPGLSLQSHEPRLALESAPTALDLLGPALGRQFGVFKQSMSGPRKPASGGDVQPVEGANLSIGPAAFLVGWAS